MILPMTSFVRSAPSGSVSSCSIRTIIAFQIAQPRPRVHVASSNGSRCLNRRWLSPDKNVHAIVVSDAGSPIPEVPKSMTALSRPEESRSAQTERGIVPAVDFHRTDRQLSPLRELGRDQPRDKLGGYGRLPHEYAFCHGSLAAWSQATALPAALPSW